MRFSRSSNKMFDRAGAMLLARPRHDPCRPQLPFVATPSSSFKAALRGAALALVYLFILQTSVAPLATLRMESNASLFGVHCLPIGDDGAPDASAHGSCCDAACLLHAQGASAPPAPVAIVSAPARRASYAVFVRSPREEGRPLVSGMRPQSQRAPPFA